VLALRMRRGLGERERSVCAGLSMRRWREYRYILTEFKHLMGYTIKMQKMSLREKVLTEVP